MPDIGTPGTTPSAFSTLDAGAFAKCAPSLRTNIRQCGTVTQMNAAVPTVDELATMFQQFRPYVLMMLSRARSMIALEDKEHGLALKHAEWGIQEIRDFLLENASPEAVEQSPEIQFLQNWIKEIERERPLTPREKLHRQMQEAVANEDYERAARLRDALNELR